MSIQAHNVSDTSSDFTLIPFLTGAEIGPPHDYLFWRKWEQNAMAIRHGNYKLIANKQKQKGSPNLYNLSKDKNERIEIGFEKKKISKQLHEKWEHWNSEMKDRVFPTLGQDVWWTEKK